MQGCEQVGSLGFLLFQRQGGHGVFPEAVGPAVGPHSCGELACDGQCADARSCGLPWYLEGRADSALWKTVEILPVSSSPEILVSGFMERLAHWFA